MKETAPITKFTGYQKFVIAILALLQFTVILDFMIISPLGDILMKKLDMSTANFGLVVSAYAFSAGASGLMAAGFADKYDRKKLLLFFYAGFIAGTLFCALSNGYIMLLIARIVTGFFGGVIGSISLAIIADLFEVNQRGRVMGFVQMAFATSQILGIPIGIFFANQWGWHSAFLMVVVFASLIFVAVFFKLHPVDAHLKVENKKNPLLHLWHTLQKKEYRIGFGTVALLSVGGFMLQPFGSAFLVNNIGISQHDLPIVFFCTGISVLFIMPIVGKLSDKINKMTLFTVGSLISVTMILIYTNLSVSPLWEIIVINMVLFMGIMSRIVPSQALNTAIPDMQDRGAYMAVTSSMQQIAGGIAAVIAGYIVYQPTKTSPLENYPTLGIVIASTTLLTIFLMRRVAKIANAKIAAHKADPIEKPE
ncbi:MFS transporter [Flavobacterium silvaticum]|uniref:MFS transporter n=1 Tax=Flavobacterium silvaticum TaxID=1852020 RepID=A0A972JJ31_9FLAO|nr:MFS transporter [Flavobacterium silvaticum]NMH27807.1 MFS transporter [Flavobacterium silvaticum]